MCPIELQPPEDFYNKNSPDERAAHLLKNTIRDRNKMHQRKILLDKHPECRITVNTKKLKKIIDYTHFICHPNCSVARNQAIKGSDIDGALVVTKEAASEADQKLFVDELREQGFTSNTSNDPENNKKTITFTTLDEIKAEMENNTTFSHTEIMYRAGFKIT